MNSILQDFLKNVKDKPNDLAIKCENEELSYKQLDDLSNKIAIFLSMKIRKTDEIIPIYLDKSPIVIACVFACWKLGLAYSIIDKSTPIKRGKIIFNKLESSIIIDDNFISSFYRQKSHNNNKFSSNKKLLSKNSLNELAAIIFTSGSAGIPKGVMLSHRNFSFIPLVYYEIIDENTIFLNLAGLSFILGLMAIFAPLSKGSSTHIVKDDKITNIEYLSKYIKENNIDHCIFVPQLAQIFLKLGDGLLKTMFVEGDINSNIYSNKTIIYNGFGQSETGGIGTYFKVDKSYAMTPIGKPFEGVLVYLLDENEKLIREENTVGEICFSGNIALGYYKDEKLTKEKFIPNPFSKSQDDKILLKTGDLAYYNENCDLVYYQRKDFMLNIHGYRVEPIEVEQALLKVDGINKIVVAGFNASKLTGIDNDVRLYAGYVSDKLIDEDNIKNVLKKLLPDYMIPSVIKRINQLPLNDRGKVDRKNIVPKNIEELFKNNEETIIKPINEIEEKLVNIIKELLSIKNNNISTGTNLFSLGLHSLLTIKLSNIILKEFNKSINQYSLLDNPTIKNIAKKIIKIEDNNMDWDNDFNDREVYYPLMSNQLDVYLDQVKNPNTTLYNIPFIFEFDKSIDIDKLRKSIVAIFNSYPYLKSTLAQKEDKILLKRNDNSDILIENVENVKDSSELIKPFELINNNLYRIVIINNKDMLCLFLDFNHIIFDYGSIYALILSMKSNYCSSLNKQLINTNIFHYQKEKDESDERFYSSMLKNVDSGIKPFTTVIKDKEKINRQMFKINKKTIDDLALKYGISSNILFLSSYLLLLNKLSLQNDNNSLISISISNRPGYLYNNPGMFVNTIPFNYKLNKNKTLKEYISDLSKKHVEFLQKPNYSLFQMKKRFGFIPTCHYTFKGELYGEYYNVGDDFKYLKNIISLNLNQNTIIFPFSLQIDSQKDNYILNYEYDREKYNTEYIKIFNQSLNLILTNKPSTKIKNIELITEKDKKLIINKYNNTNNLKLLELSQNETVVSLFERKVESNPSNIALVYNDTEITYNQLNEYSNIIANYLINDRSISLGDFVALKLSRSPSMIIGILGVLKAGKAYVPLATDIPLEREKHILKETKASIVLDDKLVNEILNGDEVNVFNPKLSIACDSLAYLIYTSGTTGVPKGVMIKHSSLVSLLFNGGRLFSFGFDDVFSLFHQYYFDFSVWEIFASLCNGSKLLILSEYMRKDLQLFYDYVYKNNLSILNLTPLVFEQFIEIYKQNNKKINTLRYIIFGGEKLNFNIIDKWFKIIKNDNKPKLVNMYGITEITIHATYQLLNKKIIDENLNKSIIGMPLTNTKIYLLDDDLRLLPIGAVGELYISGVGLAEGYLNDPNLTKEKFILNPYTQTTYDKCLYKTGDLARYINKEGGIEYLSRLDDQVKIRGHRVELEDIASQLILIPEIKQATVIVNNNQLIGYYVSNTVLKKDYMRNILLQSLPEYMIPIFYQKIDFIPLTSNGKIDKKSLQKVFFDSKDFTLPNNSLEKEIFELCADILGYDDFGVTNNLISIGFTSLSLIKLLTRIFDEYNVELGLTKLLESDANIISICEQIKELYGVNHVKHENREFYPLSSQQWLNYVHDLKSQDKAFYNINGSVFFKNVDAMDLKEALSKTIDMHPYIKTRLTKNNKSNRVYQKHYNDIVNYKDNIEIQKAQKDINTKLELEKFIEISDLIDAPLYHFKITYNSDDCYLCYDFKHMIIDAFSLKIFFDDLNKILFDEIDLKEEEFTYYDYVLDELEFKKSEHYKEDEQYFKNKLIDFDGVDFLNGDKDNFKQNYSINKVLKTKIENFSEIQTLSKNLNITPNIMILGACLIAISKFSYNQDILMSIVHSNRNNIKFKDSIGFFASSSFLYYKINGMFKVKDYLLNLNEEYQELLKHTHYPLSELVEKYPNIHSEIAFNHVDTDLSNLYDHIEASEISDFRFHIRVENMDKFFNLSVSYDDIIYSSDFVNNFLNSVQRLLNYFIKDNTKLLNSIPLIDYMDNIVIEELDNAPVTTTFKKCVKDYADKVAFNCDDGSYTYKDLDCYSNKIANALIKRGVVVGDVVGVMLKRDSRLINTIFGIIKSGACFMLIDPDFPRSRIELMIKSSDAKYVINNEKVFDNSLLVNDLLLEYNDSNPNLNLNGNDLLYISFTSGSSGEPKGVLITHEAVTNKNNPKNMAATHLKEFKSLLSFTTVSFVLFPTELFLTILNGVLLILADDKSKNNPVLLIKLIIKYNIGQFILTSSLLETLINNENFKNIMEELKFSLSVAGEAMTEKLFNLLQNIMKNTDICVSYGATELAGDSTFKVLDNLDDIDKSTPLFNYLTMVTDLDGQPLPNGVVGELWFGGSSVAKGYLNDLKLTEKTFITINGIRFFKTGDLARIEKTGDLKIFGRIDKQIKLHGQRMNPIEIEKIINQYNFVESSVVILKVKDNNTFLCGYLKLNKTLENNEFNLFKKELLTFLKDKLPHYMVPQFLIKMDEFPLTQSGKVNTKELPNPHFDDLNLEGFSLPKTTLEKELFDICSEILAHDNFGVNSSFSSIGFTSLTLIRLSSYILKKYSKILELSDLMGNDTNILSVVDKITGSSAVDYVKHPVRDYYPLTSQQLGVFLDCMKNPDKIMYNIFGYFKFE
ncbi:MAG: amino acid adenylation domain-containing protein, partial [Methanobrevibacter sp.]|nr:amino acid adenylation domain-containing protein [Methanobrevibacter sp.]